jgi:succinate dehydrogenase/fumarate reductase flavoprotein subunit
METFDVVVLGTGAAALTAAIRAHDEGATVGLFEKADTVGGTSAWSGGMTWIPMNPHMAELGIEDTREEVLTYLRSLSHGLIDEELAGALVDAGPETVSWLEANTPVKFQIIKDFPDYHPEHPGAKRGGGRSLECPLYPFAELGEWRDKVTVGPQLSGNIMMSETSLGRGAPDGVAPAELERRRIRDERGAGQGLIGPLLKACLDRDIVPRTAMRAVELLTSDGRVTGVRFETGDGTVDIGARRGVVIATGGFEWNPDLVRAFTRGPLARSASVPTNTGDGLKMVMRVGAQLGNMREAWWVPIIDVPVGDRMAGWQVNGERTRPHSIMVNKLGKRFTNEAANYNALGAAFHVIDVSTFDYVNHPAWMIYDRHYLTRYGLAGFKGDGPTPGWMTEADTIEDLATAIGLPVDALRGTVTRWNEQAERRKDEDFGRGDSAHDRWWGDPSLGDGPQATMGALDTAPYYAVRVYAGALGTKGGPRTNGDGQVLDVDGHPIAGLYAAGNAMASVMGMTYGGAGGTLGPALVFGYLTGGHAAHAEATS